MSGRSKSAKRGPGHLRLGVNIDHVATIRNARGGRHPDPLRAAHLAVEAGADGITAHLREDRRHISDADIARLKRELTRPLNFEMAATDEMLAIALRHVPHACCLVPEKREEKTTEGGLDVVRGENHLRRYVDDLKSAGIRVSLFIEPDAKAVEAAPRLGAAGRRAAHRRLLRARAGGRRRGPGARARPARAARRALAAAAGLEVHAGHGLTFNTVAAVARIAEIVELNIGHFLVGEAIFGGLGAAVARMRALMDEAAPDAVRCASAPRAAVILGLGNDIIDIRRIEKTIERYGDRFLHACLHRHGAQEIGRPRRPRRVLRQALCGQGGLRQGAGNGAQAGACSGATWASSTCPRAGPPWC